MKRAFRLFLVMAIVIIVGTPVISLAQSKSNEPIWSTDTVPPAPAKEIKAPAPKEKPYDGPVWSTDSTTPAPPKASCRYRV